MCLQCEKKKAASILKPGPLSPRALPAPLFEVWSRYSAVLQRNTGVISSSRSIRTALAPQPTNTGAACITVTHLHNKKKHSFSTFCVGIKMLCLASVDPPGYCNARAALDIHKIHGAQSFFIHTIPAARLRFEVSPLRRSGSREDQERAFLHLRIKANLAPVSSSSRSRKTWNKT